jgi:hypothetical protein
LVLSKFDERLNDAIANNQTFDMAGFERNGSFVSGFLFSRHRPPTADAVATVDYFDIRLLGVLGTASAALG